MVYMYLYIMSPLIGVFGNNKYVLYYTRIVTYFSEIHEQFPDGFLRSKFD